MTYSRDIKYCDHYCRSDGTLVLDKLGKFGSESKSSISAYYPRTNNRQYELSNNKTFWPRVLFL